jgi:hypothetical protein
MRRPAAAAFYSLQLATAAAAMALVSAAIARGALLPLTTPSCAPHQPHTTTPIKQEDEFCDEFHLVDLRMFENCKKVSEGCDHVFNLAADMGGMGFIQSNHSVILYNNTMISYNMMEAARQNGITRWVVAGVRVMWTRVSGLTRVCVRVIGGSRGRVCYRLACASCQCSTAEWQRN